MPEETGPRAAIHAVESPPTFVVMYGSQTGTAEDCAHRISREAHRRRYANVTCISCDEDPTILQRDDVIVLLILATTGNGVHPDGMDKMYRSIMRNNLQKDALSNLRFAVCGLGDSSYQKFNFVAKKVYRRLLNLGAVSLVDPCYSDEQHDLGVDGMIDPWLNKLWESTAALRADLPPLEKTLDWRKYEVVESSDPVSELGAPRRLVKSHVLLKNRMTPEDHFQNTRLLTLDAPRPFETGSVAVILPKNCKENVERFLSIFNHIDSQRAFSISKGQSEVPEHLQSATNLQNLARHHFDLNSVPKRSFFDYVRQFYDKETESLQWEKMNEFSQAEGQPDLVDYSIRPKRTCLEVFDDFPGLAQKLDVVDLLTIIPAIRPRKYSIANSYSKNRVVEILYAVVDYKTMLKKRRIGLCTSYLEELQVGDEVFIDIERGCLSLPEDISAPVIFIAPGTGIAGVRGFIQDLGANGARTPMTLFYGSRSESKDFYFREEWLGYKSLKVITAFSRDQDHKVYVQHRMEQEKELFLDGSSTNVHIYICGNANGMVSDVLKVLEGILGKQTVQEMEKQKRLQSESWA